MKNWILAGTLLVAFSGNSLAGLEEGKAAARQGNFKRAIQEVHPDAQRGDPEAQRLLGSFYEMGLYQYGEAMKWYRKASDQGSSTASVLIGSMYSRGLGVTQDYSQTIQWNRKAYYQGDRSGSLFRVIGRFYAGGYGVQQNFPIAYALTQLSYKFDTNPKYDNSIEGKMNRQQLADGKKLLEQLSSSNDIFATIDSYAGSQEASTSTPAAPDNSRVLLQGGQTWTGQYRCAQGLTPFTVQFTRVTPTTDSERYQIDGTFSFGGQGMPSGSYGLSGVYFASQGNFQLEPTRWIQRPMGYQAVGLSGSLKSGTNGTNLLTGQINHPSCSDFQLALRTPAGGVQPQSEPSNRTTASDSTPKTLIDYLPPAREPEDQTRRICRGDVDARITDRSYEGKLFSSGAMEIVGDWARKYYAPGRTRQDCPKINPVNALIYWKYAIGASNLSGTWTNEDVDRFIAERQKAELAMRADQPSRLQPSVAGNALLPRD